MNRGRIVVARAGSRKSGGARPAAPVHPVLGLQRSIGNGAVARLLQRAPETRVTAHETSTGGRIKGRSPAVIAATFRDLREKHSASANALLNDLQFDQLWGRSDSDVTNTGDNYTVRIDRQNPTPTHSNVQIQTNGKVSISLATVLVSDALYRTENPAAVVNAVKRAFRSSLGDGMQWEVYDAVEAEKVEPKRKGKSPDQGDKGKKGKGGKGGGGGRPGRRVEVH